MVTFPIGTGHGLLSCPAGAGLLPGAHFQGAATHGAAALSGATAGVPKGACAVGIPAALGNPGQGALVGGAGKSAIAKGLAANGMAKGVVAGGTLAGGKGLSLGLGIGLGLWGPTILAGLGLVAAYTLWKSQSTARALNEDDIEIGEALSNR